MLTLSFRIMPWQAEESAESNAHAGRISRLRLEMTVLG